MAGLAVAVSDETFKAEVLDSKIPALVDFWAEWCGPCVRLSPTIEDIAKEYEGRIKVCKVNVDHNPLMAGQLGVSGIPAIFFFKDGQVVDTVVGLAPKQAFTQRLDKILQAQSK